MLKQTYPYAHIYLGNVLFISQLLYSFLSFQNFLHLLYTSLQFLMKSKSVEIGFFLFSTSILVYIKILAKPW